MTLASRSAGVALALTAALLALFVWSVGTGEIAIPPGEVIATLLGGGDRSTSFVIETLRLPRALTGALIGIALGASGAIFQSITRNPLGSPDIVGFVQGASAAAVLEIVVFGGGTFAVAAGAVVGGLVTALVVYGLSARGGVQGYRLVLVGIGVSAILIAVTDYLLTRSTLEQAQSAQVWLTGSLNGRGWEHVRPIAAALALLLPATALLIRPLRMLELGDDTRPRARRRGRALAARARADRRRPDGGGDRVGRPDRVRRARRAADRAPADPRERPGRRLRRADGRRAAARRRLREPAAVRRRRCCPSA